MATWQAAERTMHMLPAFLFVSLFVSELLHNMLIESVIYIHCALVVNLIQLLYRALSLASI